MEKGRILTSIKVEKDARKFQKAQEQKGKKGEEDNSKYSKNTGYIIAINFAIILRLKKKKRERGILTFLGLQSHFL